MRVLPFAALSAAVVTLPLIAVSGAVPSVAQSAPPPILVEELTPRSSFPDRVSLQLRIKHDGQPTRVVRADPSRMVVARITVQPGAQFPLHTHPGPVVVNVVSGELTYVDPDSCEERVYPAGTAFTDSGSDGHTAYGSSSQVTELMATFFGAPATGPLTVREPVQTTTC